MLRKVLGILAGLAIALVLVTVSRWLVNYIAPPPPGDYADPEFLRAMIARAPAGWLLGGAIGCGISAFVGAAWAAVTARDGPWPAWTVAGLLGAATLARVVILPHPLWFTLLALALIGMAGWLAGLAFGREADHPAPARQAPV